MDYNLINLIAMIGLCASGVIMCATVIFAGFGVLWIVGEW